MIKVNSTDTITHIVNRIKECEEKEIILDFSLGNPILNNHLSLKILKNAASEKRITIITKDLTSKKIGIPLGINYSNLKDNFFTDDKNINQKLVNHNFSHFEYFLFLIKSNYRKFINFFLKKTGLKKVHTYNNYNKVKTGGYLFLFIGLITSIGMLLFIFYFAVSKTFIEIIPNIEIRKENVNISFQENYINDMTSNITNNRVIGLKKITHTIKYNSSYKTTGIDYNSQKRSKGKVTFYNKTGTNIKFIKNTRLLSDNGLLYQTDEDVNIPRALVDSNGKNFPGNTIANVTAMFEDINNEFIGKKGNIKGKVKFSVYNLQNNKENIYAELYGEMKGGEDDVENIVGKNDLQKAKDTFLEDLKKEVKSSLEEKIKMSNEKDMVNFQILNVENMLDFNNIEISTFPETIKEGDRLQEIKLKGKITLDTYIYNKNQVISLLREIINNSIINGTEKIMYIDEKSLAMRMVISRINNPLNIKITTEINTGISYDFNNNQNQYIRNLKILIFGKTNDEAKNVLLNENKISDVKIINRPFFINKISGNTDNIIMKIVE